MEPSDSSQGWERIWSEADKYDYWHHAAPAILEWAREIQDEARRVFDLGCGIGRHTLALSLVGLKAIGGDVSPSGLTACADRMQRAGFSPSLAQHNMVRIPFASDSFDALLAYNVIYHATLADLQACITEIHRILRPQGSLAITFLGRLEENISRNRADVARGICQEIEPFTFIYPGNARGDKYLPHHYCDEEEVRQLLQRFTIESIDALLDEYTGEDGTLYRSLHYDVRARRN